MNAGHVRARRRALRPALVLAALLPGLVQPLAAQEASTSQLAQKAQNPLANIMSFPFQNNTSYRIGAYDRTQNVLNIQPVIPFAGGRVITRTIFPVVWQPDVTSDAGTSTGLGDIQFTAVLARQAGRVTWGMGPMVTLPTGGRLRGSEKWSVGPSLILLAMPGHWVLGGLVNYSRSFAGKSDRADVSQLLIQPFINYNLGETGWYLATSPIITADLKAPSGERWTVPVGAAIGKVSRVGARGLPVNIQVGAFYNVKHPSWGPSWSSRVQVQFLLPKGRGGRRPDAS